MLLWMFGFSQWRIQDFERGGGRKYFSGRGKRGKKNKIREKVTRTYVRDDLDAASQAPNPGTFQVAEE